MYVLKYNIPFLNVTNIPFILSLNKVLVEKIVTKEQAKIMGFLHVMYTSIGLFKS